MFSLRTIIQTNIGSMTYEDLAYKACVSEKTIQTIMQGRSHTQNLVTIEAILDALGLKLEVVKK